MSAWKTCGLCHGSGAYGFPGQACWNCSGRTYISAGRSLEYFGVGAEVVDVYRMTGWRIARISRGIAVLESLDGTSRHESNASCNQHYIPLSDAARSDAWALPGLTEVAL